MLLSSVMLLASSPLFWVVLAVSALIVSIFTPYDDHGTWEISVLSTVALIFFWGINNVIYMVFPIWSFVITDSLFLLLYGFAYGQAKRRFLAVIAWSLAATVVLDIEYVVGWLDYTTMMYRECGWYLVMLVASCASGWMAILTGTTPKRRIPDIVR